MYPKFQIYIIDSPTKTRTRPPEREPKPPGYISDEYLSSRDWLIWYGIVALKLEYFEFLKHLIFKHSEGVIEKCYAPITPRTPKIRSFDELELNKDELDDDKKVSFTLIPTAEGFFQKIPLTLPIIIPNKCLSSCP